MVQKQCIQTMPIAMKYQKIYFCCTQYPPPNVTIRSIKCINTCKATPKRTGSSVHPAASQIDLGEHFTNYGGTEGTPAKVAETTWICSIATAHLHCDNTYPHRGVLSLKTPTLRPGRKTSLVLILPPMLFSIPTLQRRAVLHKCVGHGLLAHASHSETSAYHKVHQSTRAHIVSLAVCWVRASVHTVLY